MTNWLIDCHSKSVVAAMLVALVGCTSGDPDLGAQLLEKDFGELELLAGAESDSLCMSWTLNNDVPIYVNVVNMEAGLGFHHSNWFFIPEIRGGEGPDGIWQCEDRNFDSLAASLYGGVLFAQSTQATSEVQQFDPNVAIRLPARARIVGQLHTLNASDADLTTFMRLSVTTIAEADATVQLNPLALDFAALTIPPQATSEFQSNCDLAEVSQAILAKPLDFRIHYVLPHYHALGTAGRLSAVDANGVETVIVDVTSRIGDPLGVTLDPPFDMTGQVGLRFSCTFDNPRGVEVGAGIGDQEMCIIVGFTDSVLTWGGSVLTSWHDRDDAGTSFYDGDCTMVATEVMP